MKRLCIAALAVAAVFTACEHPDYTEVIDDETGEVLPSKKFTFTLKGDFSDDWKPVTRGYLAADGKDLTDVWVLDYKDGVLVQQVHQGDNTADDFGMPVLNLTYGNHHVYFIASRGTSPVLDTEAHTITFGKVLDTFYKDYTVSVVATSNGNRAVTLDRCVTKLRLTFTDAISDGAATINITPHTWYYTMDYLTGNPAAAVTDQTMILNIPSTSIGSTTESASLFGFSTATEWTTDVSINSKKADNTIIGSATITSAPFKANRVTEYSGPLFSAGGSMTMSLNTTWEDAYNGVW